MTLPIFEESTSALYYSNDARLRIGAAGAGEYVLEVDGREVLRTKTRVLVDAYIAGFDLAVELADAERRHEVVEAALTRAFGPPGTVTKIDVPEE
jgi:hypothetical protein